MPLPTEDLAKVQFFSDICKHFNRKIIFIFYKNPCKFEYNIVYLYKQINNNIMKKKYRLTILEMLIIAFVLLLPIITFICVLI